MPGWSHQSWAREQHLHPGVLNLLKQELRPPQDKVPGGCLSHPPRGRGGLGSDALLSLRWEFHLIQFSSCHTVPQYVQHWDLVLRLPGSCRTQQSPPGSAGHGCFPSPPGADGHWAEVDGNPSERSWLLWGRILSQSVCCQLLCSLMDRKVRGNRCEQSQGAANKCRINLNPLFGGCFLEHSGESNLKQGKPQSLLGKRRQRSQENKCPKGLLHLALMN